MDDTKNMKEEWTQQSVRDRFSSLVEDVEKAEKDDWKEKFVDLLNFTESIEFPNIRMVASMQVIQLKRKLSMKHEDDARFEFKLLL